MLIQQLDETFISKSNFQKCSFLLIVVFLKIETLLLAI